MAKIKIIWVKSAIGYDQTQKRTIKALGLGRPNYTVVKEDTPQIRGMIRKVIHLVDVKEIQ